MPVLVAFALLLPACSGDTDSDAVRLPPSVQNQLPVDLSLGNLCPGAETPPHVMRDAEGRAEALLRELRARPDALVTYTFQTEDEGPIQEEISVRELAEIQLDNLSDDSEDGYCLPDLAARIEEAL